MSRERLRAALAAQGGWILAVALAGSALFTGWAPLARVDLLAYDSLEPLSRPALTPPDAVVVAVDEATLEALGRWPWNRAVHAELIDRLTASGVRAIGMPLLLSEAAPGDDELAAALAASGRVVLAVAPRTADREGGGVGELLPNSTLAPRAAALGHVDVALDADGLARRTFARAGSEHAHWSALALATLGVAARTGTAGGDGIDARRGGGLRRVGASLPWVREGELLLPVPDAQGNPRTLSYHSLLEQPARAYELAGRTVFIGVTAVGLDGGLATPASLAGKPMAAVEFHARAYEALRTGTVYRSTSALLPTGLALALAAAAAWLLGRNRHGGALTLGVLAAVPPALSVLALGSLKLWIPPTAAWLTLAVGGLLWLLRRLRSTRGSLVRARHDADATLRSITDAVITIDERGRVTMINPVAERLTGLGRTAARGLTLAELIGDFSAQADAASAAVHDTLGRRESVRLPEPLRWRAPDGSERALRMTTAPIGEVGKDGEGAVIVLSDVTETLAITARLQHEATHDLLTGLPNRALLLDRLQQALAGAIRRGSLVAMLFVDLDRFKRINDSLGHYVGDEVLRVVAERLQASVRAGDTVARWGGDEFIILMDNLADHSAVVRVARKLIDLLEREVETTGGTGIVLSCSVGISIGPQDSADAQTLLSMADKAMYRAKLEGGSRYTFYGPEMNTWSRDRLSLEAALRHGLANREFELFYQPQIDVASGRLAGLESLIRWHRPERGLVRPDEFIPAAEESGIIRSIGEWAIHEAAEQAARWHQNGLLGAPLAVNVSARQCSDMAIVDTIRTTLADTGLEPRMFKVELTESTAMRDPERAAELLRSIHALGAGIAVDDFGTGYSSLSLLKRFPISELKIDKSFVSDIAKDSDDAAIVRSTIALAHGLGIEVVAEGVETESQLAFLARHGCDSAQGFLFAKPLPAGEIRAWLDTPPPHVERAVRNSRGEG